MAGRKTKTRGIVERAFHEVKGEQIPRKQKIAIALSKARKRGARISLPPKKRSK